MAESDGSVATEEGSDGPNDFSLFHAALGVNRTARSGGREDGADDLSVDEGGAQQQAEVGVGGVPGEVGVNLGPPSPLAAAENPLADARGVDVAGILPSDGGQQRESTVATSAPSDAEENGDMENVTKRDRSEAFGGGTRSDSGSPRGKKSLQQNAPADGAPLPRGWKVVRYANGSVYKGELKNGKKHGQGKIKYSDGNVYEGKWKEGRKNGNGKFTWANGDAHEGEYKEDMKHGQGKYTWASGGVYEGEFKEGKRHGQGKYTWADGAVYEGKWKDWKKHGHGKMRYADGRVYEGEWEDDEMHGKGKYTWADGRVYDGEWKDGKRHGNGKYTWADGSVDDGEWYCNQRHGDFIMTKATTGAEYGQIYRDGKLLRSNPIASRRTLTLEEDDITCGICNLNFSSNLHAEENENSRRRLPVLGSCGHHCCHGCALEQQAAEARENGRVPKKIRCMICRKKGAFRPGEPTYFRVLADLIERSAGVSE